MRLMLFFLDTGNEILLANGFVSVYLQGEHYYAYFSHTYFLITFGRDIEYILDKSLQLIIPIYTYLL